MSHDFSPTTSLEGKKIVCELFEGRGLGGRRREGCVKEESRSKVHIYMYENLIMKVNVVCVHFKEK